MEDKAYIFGIGRREKTFSLVDPIAIVKDYILTDFSNYLFDFNDLSPGLLEEDRYERGIFFGFSDKKRNIEKFIDGIVLLEPSINEKGFSLYFLKDRGVALFKINNSSIENVQDIKKAIWNTLGPMDIMSKESFFSKTASWEESKEVEEESKGFSYTSNEISFSVLKPFNLFFCLKMKDYDELVSKVSSAYKGTK